ncbi:IPTL-CTERM sorting domain-containing protein [Hydrogenophaga soli]
MLNRIPLQKWRWRRTLFMLAGLMTSVLAHASYTVNADGTVTDTTTGLVWDQCAYGLSGSACATGSAFFGSWPSALAQVSAANTAGYKGFNDWRVPNKTELESIVKRDVHSPAIDTTAFPNTATSNFFWTSTTYAPNPAYAWYIYFYDGDTFVHHKANNNFVRLVRGGPSYAVFDGVGTTSYTAPTPSGSGTSGNVTTTLTGGGAASCAMGSVSYQSASSVGAAPPAGVSFPAGVVNFTTTGCAVGGTVTVTLTYPSALPAGTQLYKYGPATAGASPSWYVHPATFSNGNTTITYTVTDNGVGDSNNTAGVITDPAGPGVPGSVSGVPTLSEWALVFLAGLLGVATALGMRPLRQRPSP